MADSVLGNYESVTEGKDRDESKKLKEILSEVHGEAARVDEMEGTD